MSDEAPWTYAFLRGTELTDGYTADQVRYVWSHDHKKPLKLHMIRLPDFALKEAYVTSHTEVYATG